MNAQLIKDRILLQEFLTEWTPERICKMELHEYVGIGDKNTFCHWVEIITKSLGSISGVPSTKFEIFKYGKDNPEYSRLLFDSEYAWNPNHGKEKSKAFRKIKNHILDIINYAVRDELDKIADIPIHHLFKWKIAFLYSNEGFIPIYNKGALEYTSRNLGMTITKQTRPLDMHRYIRNTFDGDSIYDYMRELYDKFRRATGKETETLSYSRKHSDVKNTDKLERKGTLGGIVNQFHNELQNELYARLVERYGSDAVQMEKDFVDITIELDNVKILYEIKSDSRPILCIREALGQLFLYAHKNKPKKKLEFVVYGKNKPNNLDEQFIKYIQSTLNNITFRYEHP